MQANIIIEEIIIMDKLTIKQLIPVSTNFSVLIPREEEGQEVWHDYNREGMNYFWALVDGGEEGDHIQLLSFEIFSGGMSDVRNAVVAPRDRCPECGADVTPEVTPYEKAFLQYICPHCGCGLPVRPLY